MVSKIPVTYWLKVMGATVHTDFLDLFKNDWFLLSDLTDLFIGGMVGSGCSRSVFDFNLNPNWVVKIDRSGQFDNVSEWEIWHSLKDHKEYSRFLAPCHYLSQCGRVLIQSKTYLITQEQLPTELPDFIADIKIDNWGVIGNQAVCHDYANHSFFNVDKIKLIKGDFWKGSYKTISEKK